MFIDLSKIVSNAMEKVDINEIINFDNSYLEKTDIIRMSPVSVVGEIFPNDEESYHLKLNVSGTMVLPCAITLKEVDYPFNIKIDEIFGYSDEEEYLKIMGNNLDIIPIVWQNIIMEIPIRVTAPDTSDALLEGDGWKVISNEDNNKEVDPRLAKLKDLLEEKEE